MKQIDQIFDGIDESLDDKSRQFLGQAILSNNQPGFDYIEFKQSVYTLQQMGLDRETAYKSAYATAKVMGLTKEKLLTSAKHYKDILNREQDSFDEAMKNQVNRRIEVREELKSRLTQKIDAYKKKIEEIEKKKAELEKQIGAFEEKISQADKEIKNAGSKIDEAKQNFETAHRAFDHSIVSDIELMEKVLPSE